MIKDEKNSPNMRRQEKRKAPPTYGKAIWGQRLHSWILLTGFVIVCSPTVSAQSSTAIYVTSPTYTVNTIDVTTSQTVNSSTSAKSNNTSAINGTPLSSVTNIGASDGNNTYPTSTSTSLGNGPSSPSPTSTSMETISSTVAPHSTSSLFTSNEAGLNLTSSMTNPTNATSTPDISSSSSQAVGGIATSTLNVPSIHTRSIESQTLQETTLDIVSTASSINGSFQTPSISAMESSSAVSNHTLPSEVTSVLGSSSEHLVNSSNVPMSSVSSMYGGIQTPSKSGMDSTSAVSNHTVPSEVTSVLGSSSEHLVNSSNVPMSSASSMYGGIQTPSKSVMVSTSAVSNHTVPSEVTSIPGFSSEHLVNSSDVPSVTASSSVRDFLTSTLTPSSPEVASYSGTIETLSSSKEISISQTPEAVPSSGVTHYPEIIESVTSSKVISYSSTTDATSSVEVTGNLSTSVATSSSNLVIHPTSTVATTQVVTQQTGMTSALSAAEQSVTTVVFSDVLETSMPTTKSSTDFNLTSSPSLVAATTHQPSLPSVLVSSSTLFVAEASSAGSKTSSSTTSFQTASSTTATTMHMILSTSAAAVPVTSATPTTTAVDTTSEAVVTSPPVLDIKYTATLEGNCTVALKKNHTFQEEFKCAVLKTLKIESHIVVNDIRCGSILVDFTINSSTTHNLENIDWSKTNFTIFGYNFAFVSVKGPGKTTVSTTESPTSPKTEPSMALSDLDLIVIIVASVVCTTLILFGILMCVRELFKQRRAKSFNVMGNGVRGRTEDFTLTPLPRSQPEYDDNGMTHSTSTFEPNKNPMTTISVDLPPPDRERLLVTKNEPSGVVNPTYDTVDDEHAVAVNGQPS